MYARLLVIIMSVVIQLKAGTIYLDHTEPNELESENGRLPNWLLIFPGTKWCGSGSIANHYEDLGSAASTDRCCRTHDFCDDLIESNQTKFNLTNEALYTRLSCKCDEEFHTCLRNVSSKTSSKVGYIYFNILGTKCFREDYPIVRCNKYKNLPTRKCIEYEYDTSKPKIYQWFDVPSY